MKPNVSHTRKEVRKAKPIPEGYMSLDEFGTFSLSRMQTSLLVC